jgi:ATP-binding cassette subfamily B protein/subfamily B ATP-binding cassette protein MsbA
VLSPFLVLQVFDNAITGLKVDSLLFYTSLIVITTIISSGSEILYQWNISRFNRNLIVKLRTNCYEHIEKLSGNFMSNYNSGDLFTTMYRDIEEIPSILTTSLFSFLSNLITVIGLIFFLITLQFDLLLILLAFQIVLYVVQRLYNKKIAQVSEQIRFSIGALNSSAQEMIGNLFAFNEGGLKTFFKKKHNVLEADYAKVNIKGAYTITLNHSVLNFINSLTVAVLLCYGGYKVIIGTLSYGGLFTFNLYSQRFMAPILQLVDFNNNLTTCSIAWNRLQKLLNTKIDIGNGTIVKVLQGNIKFKDVSFFYEDKKPVLHDISMELKKGEIHALVGPSGVGKTTLIHLLFRLWDCKSGAITIDGINIKDLDLDCLHSQISIVSQNIFLLNETIYNNIVLGNDVTDEELDHILIQADIKGFINSLPDKLETVVGENGIKLSGGEKQRISIARALLNKSPILIFDEATSMLDNESEDKIITILLNSFKNTTIVLIAHRLSTVRNANIVYVLNNGTVVESGSHEQLLEQKGVYYNLYNI